MNKILVNLNVPTIERKYNLWIPDNSKIQDIVELMVKGINELNDGQYEPKTMPLLYDKKTGKVYDLNLTVESANIKNGTEIILI